MQELTFKVQKDPEKKEKSLGPEAQPRVWGLREYVTILHRPS